MYSLVKGIKPQQLQSSNQSAMKSGSSSSKQVSNQKGKSNMIESIESSEIANDDFWPLFEKPYVDMILSKSAVKPFYSLYLPKKMNKELPSAGAPVILTYGRKKWDLFYGGAKFTYKFISTGWRKFADDNNLKEGDGLVFELLECSTSKIEFRVQILRGDFLVELIPEDVEGTNSDNPIIID